MNHNHLHFLEIYAALQCFIWKSCLFYLLNRQRYFSETWCKYKPPHTGGREQNCNSTYTFCGTMPLWIFCNEIFVHSLTLIQLRTFSGHLVIIWCAENKNPLFMPHWNYQFENRLRSITVKPSRILSSNLVKI